MNQKIINNRQAWTEVKAMFCKSGIMTYSEVHKISIFEFLTIYNKLKNG